MAPIIFYDIPTTAPGYALSANTWITRYFGLFMPAFKIIELELVDIP
jgi:hypothetical protein